MKTITYPVIAAALLASGTLFADPPSTPSISIKASAIGPNGKIFTFNSSSDDADTQKGKTISLGVSVSKVPESVAAQLNTDAGEGLLIGYVIKDSAAAKAGLVENDVLTKLNDQELIEPGQLRTLVQNKKAGDTVTLTYFHKGKEQTATATLAEGAEPRNLSISGSVSGSDIAQAIKDLLDSNKGDIARQVESIAKTAQASGSGSSLQNIAGLSGLLSSGLASASVSTRIVNSLTGEATQSDDSGSITVNRKDGHNHLHASAKDDKVLFDGPIDTPDQQAKVPANIMDKAQKLLDDLKKSKEDTDPQSRNAGPGKTGSVG